ncbi:MAG: N,N-dimethylformamidase beta subunit family domain-containing protein [Myxococcales bacterium]|nr:hypothetical protein [Myxococcales bacterium]
MVRLLWLAALCVACGAKTPRAADTPPATGSGPPDQAPSPPPPATADAGPDGPDAGTADAGAPDGGTAMLPLRQSPIVDENQRQGGRSWRLSQASTQLAAYADRTSALPGEQVAIRAGASNPTTATWQLWRLGYYGGEGGRKILDGTAQIPVWSATVMDRATGAVSAPWPTAFTVTLPSDAVTGAYLIKIISSLGQTYATFVVREPAPGATILYSVSTNTYQAYNAWGGTSLYDNFRSDWSKWHAFAVSFDRPYLQDFGAGELFSKDRDFIYFAESQGYDIAYVSDADLDRDPSLVERRRMVLLQGHSEYWTEAMRNAVENAVSRGSNLAVLAANTSYWQVRFADASRRVLIGYKDFAPSLDPVRNSDPLHLTTLWRNAPLNRPENAVFGEMYGSWLWTDAPATVTDPSSWVWAGANVTSGTLIPGAYGDESDHRYANGDEPAGTSVIANAMVEDHEAAINAAESTIYTTPAGGRVFASGSITWGNALARAGRWDPRIQQLVANVFSKLAGDGTLGSAALKPLSLPEGAAQPQYRHGVKVSTVTRALDRPVAVAAAGPDAIVVDGDRIVRVSSDGAIVPVAGGAPGFADGPAAQAQFRGPRGVAVASSGTIYVSDTGNNRIRAIAGGNVWTVAGSGLGFADGPGAQALFSEPMGIALTANGSLLVADAWNQRVREVAPAGSVSTWAGCGLEGTTDGPGTTARVNFPISVAVLPSGDAVVASSATGVLRRIAGTAPHSVSTLAGSVGNSGWADGPASSAQVSETLAVAALRDGQLAFLDGASARVRVLRNGLVETLAGGQRGGTVDGFGDDAGFGWPRAIAAAPDGSLLVADPREHALRRITLGP